MMRLRTLSEKVSNTEARVVWRTGERLSGILDVTLEQSHEESDLLAELAAIKYLLFEKQVFDRVPVSPQGYQLIVSKGAIKKLARNKSNKTFAQLYAFPLTTRLEGISIEVSQKREWFPDPAEIQVEPIYVQKAFAREYDVIDTPAIGRVLVTQHAVDQYTARVLDEGAKNARASLQQRLGNPELRVFDLDEAVLQHKAKKYGRADNIQVWGHPTSTTRFMVLRDKQDYGVLVTVFKP